MPLLFPNKMAELTRAFIAIDFPDEVIKEVARVQGVLGKKKFTGKMTELENLHLTLKFLGEIDEGTIKRVKERLKGVRFDAFEAKLGRCGTFSIRSYPKIAWIKVNGNVFKLQKQIDNALKDLFDAEERFMSHLTIARIKYVEDKDYFKEYISNLKLREIRFKVDKFKLMKSDLREAGPIYSAIEEYNLQ